MRLILFIGLSLLASCGQKVVDAIPPISDSIKPAPVDTVLAQLPEELAPEPEKVEEPSRREIVKALYDSHIGVREKTGKNDGEEVEKYLAYVGLGKGYAWCAAFVCFVYGEAGVKNPKSAWSPSMFPSANTIYQRNRNDRQGIPQYGDTFGIWFANLGRVAHVGFVDEWNDGSYFYTVEGNTNDAGSREGDGVYRKRRLKTQVYQVSDFINN